ncbi:metallo-beta-lactamase superfamily protein [Aneurinibacillus soli]|uniref:Hydroxyacylglutathione hydrolase n=1 Tax=Aneurinibacillus soli TaxID=1500254 RepID=A0A0U5AW37_9BACL|nr:MBL fold metallo-hydrolase [Aneurinibacillus soli]PYE64008.1 metallo-beta-lactamase superfamily protein [Aneurinibacillus soli]BAU27957.1 Hydroxyacylglutathione hydrolase [Aneurinibacillus soli]
MTATPIVDLGHDIFQIELVDRELNGRSTGYFINAEQKTIVEMGASVSVPRVLAALEQLDVQPEDISYVIVTHIHLDHAGGAGLLLEKLPNAKLIVHPRGVRHMIDPTKLIAGARAVYGDSFDRLFAPILPIAEERIIVADDGMELSIGENRTLVFYDSPGHAYHHYAVYDAASRGIFSGDAIGITFPRFTDVKGMEFYAPTSSPTQFDPDAMSTTLRRFAELDLEYIYLTHYGHHSNARQVIADNLRRTEGYARVAEQTYRDGGALEEMIEALRTYFYEELAALGIEAGDPVLEAFEFDIEMNAKGMYHYMQTKTKA